MSVVKLGKVTFTPKGAYDISTTYDYLDCVTYQGNLFAARKNTLVGVTPVEGDDWMLLIQSNCDGGMTYIKLYDKTDEGYYIWASYDSSYWAGSNSDVDYDPAEQTITTTERTGYKRPEIKKYYFDNHKMYCEVVDTGLTPTSSGVYSIPAYIYCEFNNLNQMVRHREIYNGARYQKYEGGSTNYYTGKESGDNVVWTPEVSGRGTQFTDTTLITTAKQQEYCDGEDHAIDKPPSGSTIIDSKN